MHARLFCDVPASGFLPVLMLSERRVSAERERERRGGRSVQQDEKRTLLLRLATMYRQLSCRVHRQTTSTVDGRLFVAAEAAAAVDADEECAMNCVRRPPDSAREIIALMATCSSTAAMFVSRDTPCPSLSVIFPSSMLRR